MAVQIPDPGTGNGQTGDNEYVFRKKVKDNFNDQTNAASRLVGTAAGTVPENTTAFGVANCGYAGRVKFLGDINLDVVPDNTGKGIGVNGSAGLPCGFYYSDNPSAGNYRLGNKFFINVNYGANHGWRLGAPTSGKDLYFQWSAGTAWSEVVKLYHTGNTTKDSNGFLKAASPIVKVFADKVELNADAIDQNVTYKKNGIGDYTITTQSGLSTDGWYIELPKDMNGNPKVAVTLQETDGVISLKSYKRIFSMETFTFVPDLNEPLDIPDGRWIDLRLNEIPVEPSEPESEV